MKAQLTLVQYPQRGEDVAVSLLEKERHSVATDQRHAVPAFSDSHVALLREDVLQVRLGETSAGAGRIGQGCVCNGYVFVLLTWQSQAVAVVFWIRYAQHRLVRGSWFSFAFVGVCTLTQDR